MTYESNDKAPDTGAQPEMIDSSSRGFAALSSSLLARKGEAAPAMEPFAQARAAPGSAREMGPGERHVLNKPTRGETAPSTPGDNCPRKLQTRKKAAITFRMTTHDYLRLKLASAELETPAQDIIIAALQSYLDAEGVERLDECLCLQKTARVCEDQADRSEETFRRPAKDDVAG